MDIFTHDAFFRKLCCSVDFLLYSSRWGCTDLYQLEFNHPSPPSAKKKIISEHLTRIFQLSSRHLANYLYVAYDINALLYMHFKKSLLNMVSSCRERGSLD